MEIRINWSPCNDCLIFFKRTIYYLALLKILDHHIKNCSTSIRYIFNKSGIRNLQHSSFLFNSSSICSERYNSFKLTLSDHTSWGQSENTMRNSNFISQIFEITLNNTEINYFHKRKHYFVRVCKFTIFNQNFSKFENKLRRLIWI